jgi:predicted metal-dependent peptidase
MDATRKLKKAKISLMRSPKFALWQGIFMLGTVVVRDDIPTACTDGWNEMYGLAFIEELPDKQLAYVVAHEGLHKALRQLTTWRALWTLDAKLANAAMDYVINLILNDTDPYCEVIEMPMRDGKVLGLIDEKYRGMNTKQVFDILKQEQEEGGGGGGGGFDDHDWEGASEQPAEEVEAQAKEVERALRQGRMLDGKMNGKNAGNLPREIADLLKPKVDWREQLREFVNSICANKDASSWRRVNRRFLHMDTYMPSLVGESVGHIVIGIDTSGSIRTEEITRFLSEVQAIANHVHPEKVDLIYWDHEVAGHEEYDAASLMTLVNSTKPRGGGGTNPNCVSTYLKDKKVKPECIIMLTDGYVGSWGNDWDAPTLWAITDNEQAMSPVGKTIHMAA